MFQSTRPVRGATERYGADWLAKKFQSTRPVRGATSHSLFTRRFLPCFNPRAPCGARLLIASLHAVSCRVSIHAPRAGRDTPAQPRTPRELVSIHAPRAGRDSRTGARAITSKSFNPRAPCGARHTLWGIAEEYCAFQSTRPVRGATLWKNICAMTKKFQSTRPVRGATFTLTHP